MFITFIRTAILYTLVVIIMRLMGKRQIGELQPYEFVITIMISDLAALPMQDTRLPLLLGIIPIITLLFLKTILSQLQLKFQVLRKVIDGEPSILIHAGKLNYNVLKSQQINIDELIEELRLLGYFDIQEIQYAILENNGKLSILPMDKNKENTPNLPTILISDGKINKNSLTSSNKDIKWITNILHENGIKSIDEVLIALLDTHGDFKYQLYDEYERKCKK
ncbi:MAG: DUF421 domain-containing protein [Clostridiales bacterium]|nr:DUF421 domain-containing protein [Clostridiales bacterium]